MGWVSSVGPPGMAPILYVHCITCIYHFYDKMFLSLGKNPPWKNLDYHLITLRMM